MNQYVYCIECLINILILKKKIIIVRTLMSYDLMHMQTKNFCKSPLIKKYIFYCKFYNIR